MILVHIVNQLTSPQDIVSFCQVNRYVHQLVNSADFWLTAVANRFPSQGQWRPESMTWREYYLELVWSVVTPPQLVVNEHGSHQEWIFNGQQHRLNDLP
jgi:hypothetical protein